MAAACEGVVRGTGVDVVIFRTGIGSLLKIDMAIQEEDVLSIALVGLRVTDACRVGGAGPVGRNLIFIGNEVGEGFRGFRRRDPGVSVRRYGHGGRR